MVMDDGRFCEGHVSETIVYAPKTTNIKLILKKS